MFVFAANPLQPLIEFFEAILKFFHDTGGLGWGMAIIALTLCVRLALLPLTLKQFKSMQSMARLQPEMKKLQERYKGDKERLNQEMMGFYRENKVNPFASCLPMVAQLPVFLALFYMLRADLRQEICPDINPPSRAEPVPCGDGGDAAFLFIPDLTNRAYGYVLVTLIVLYVGSQLLSTLLMATTTDKTQRMIFLALPFFFVLFVWQFPAGLLVYWITTNLWTIVQQAIVRKRLGPLRPPGQEQESLSDMIGKLTGRHADDRDGDGDGDGKGPGKRGTEKPASGRAKATSPAVPAQAAVAGNEPKGPPERSATGPAAQEEEALREATMSEATGGTQDTPVERVREVLETLGEAMGLDAEVHVEESEDGIRGVLEGDDLGLFIGRHGQTIDAVQHLAFKIANRDGTRGGTRVVVDAAGYRGRREQALHRQADQAAADAISGGRPVALDAMSATERKVVHEYLKDRDDVETYSEGTEPDRHLVVAPLQP